MARKKVYYSKMIITKKDVKQRTIILKNLIIKKAKKEKDKKKSHYTINLSEHGKAIFLDIINYNEFYFFARVGKEKESNSLLKRNIVTGISNDILNQEELKNIAIEAFTYLYLDYKTGIITFVAAQSAPSVKIMKSVVKYFNPDLEVDILSIPNNNSIKELYQPGSDIRKISLRIPIADSAFLEEIGLSDNEILKLVNQDVKTINIEIKGETHNPLTDNISKIKNIIDKLMKNKNNYSKAIIAGKSQLSKVHDFNLFADIYTYNVDIKTYKIENGRRIYSTLDEVTNEFKKELNSAYNEKSEILILACKALDIDN